MNMYFRYRMGDGAREITKAGEEVFGKVGSELMCRPHTYRNLLSQMAALRSLKKKLQLQLLSDIQWSCHSEDTFLIIYRDHSLIPSVFLTTSLPSFWQKMTSVRYPRLSSRDKDDMSPSFTY